VSGRTVREEGADCSRVGADCPKLLPEPPVVHQEKRTVHDGPADCPPHHGPSGTLVRTVRKLHGTKNLPTKWIERKVIKNSHEHEEQLGCQAPHGRSAVTSRTVHQVRISTTETPEEQPQTSDRRISQTTWSLETNFWGDEEHPIVKICPQKLRPLTY
jgi:hypothetical protein